VGVTWCRYGHAKRATAREVADAQLDRLIPLYDVVEGHCVRVSAPAGIAFSAACDLNLRQSAIIRAIFKSRELILGGKPEGTTPPLRLMDQASAWGWGVLAKQPGRWIVFGGVTQPWIANPVFRALPPADFAGFHEPDYVKIAWTLRADSRDATSSIARTETRVIATDADARRKFRRYWAFVLPGIKLIRRMALGLVRAEAERRTKRERST
jgi:hypothetical protein